MKLEGKYHFAPPLQRVWDGLNDPIVLEKATPGCIEFRQSGPDQYNAVMEMGVAGIKGRYKGKIIIQDRQPLSGYRLIIEGSGTPGFVGANVVLRLVDAEEGTDLTYTGEAQVGGLVAGVGQRLLGGVARMIMEQFFKSVERSLTD